jgi:septum formation topological specificity factor MinE
MKISKHLNRAAMGAIKGRMNAKTIRRARLAALNMKVQHNQLGTVKVMKEEGVEILKIAFLIENDEVKIAIDPKIKVDVAELLKDSEQLLEWGFKLIELELGYHSYRVVTIEYNDERVQKYLSSSENLFKALATAQKMEGKIIK